MALVGAAAFVAPGSAWATTGHSFVGQFGGQGTGDGQFAQYVAGNATGPVGVGVLASTGEVFTADLGVRDPIALPRVQRFSADGVFMSAFALDATPITAVGPLAVDPAGAVYVATSTEVSLPAVVKYSAAGVFAYELDASGSATTLNNPAGPAPLAVDPVDGTVYVAAAHDDGRQVIDRFDGSTGAFIDFIDGSGSVEGGFSCPSGLAVDGSQRVYVLDSCKNGTGRVDRFSAAGVVEASLDLQLPSAETLSAVAVDPVSDEVYVSHSGPVGTQVTHLTAGGATPVYTFDAFEVGGVRAMAVSGAGTVYTSDLTKPFVERFARFDGPTVVTGGTQPPEARSVVLEGTINPESVDSSYYFEYGTDLTYGSRTVGDIAAGTGSDPVPASALATGLQPNTTYFYRLVGSNSSGSIAGAAGSFTTAAVPSDVGGGFASAITPRSARIHGAVNPNNNFLFTTWHMEYGTTTAYGSTVSTLPLGFCGFGSCGGADVPVFADLSGLEPGTLYHFRVVAVDDAFGAAVPQFGADQTFYTAPAAGGGATDVTTRRATLTATINPHGEQTTYYFNYGKTSSYGASTPEVGAGSGDGDQVVTDSIAGLKPDTTYHVQVVAKSGDVTRFGGDGLFKTPPAPKATAISPTGISTNSATLVGNVETHGQTGSYRFDVSSLDSAFSTSTAPKPVAGNASAERVTAPITGLPAGESFVVSLTVDSNDSIGVSDQVVFSTASLPRVFPTAPTGNGSYGCQAPRLDAYDKRPKPGDTIRVTGQGLGIGGDAVLGDRSLVPADWTANGFALEVPDDATGTLGLTVNCGRRSNTIAIAVFSKPDNKFSIRKQSTTAAAAVLSVKVPGPGKLQTTGARTKRAKTTVRKAGTATVTVRLSRAGRKALANTKSGTLRVTARVRFTPAGGKPATKTIGLTFEKAGR